MPLNQQLEGHPLEASSWMRLALEQAYRALELGEVPVGAVVVSKGQVLSQASNQVQTLNDPTAHAELLALRAASRLQKAPRLPDCELYVTLEPCTLCACAISLFRVRRLYFGAYDPKGGAVEHGPRWFNQAVCHHKPQVYGGIAESQASTLLQQFFAAKRQQKGPNVARTP